MIVILAIAALPLGAFMRRTLTTLHNGVNRNFSFFFRFFLLLLFPFSDTLFIVSERESL
jgi:hypothetical protein